MKAQNLQVATKVYNQYSTFLNDSELEVKNLEVTQSNITVISTPVTALPLNEQIKVILKWAKSHESKTVCVANVHMLMEAYWNPEFSYVLKSADLVTPDGMPLVWMMRLMGTLTQDRVAGLDLLLYLCWLAPLLNIKVFFLGSAASTLEKMSLQLKHQFPDLNIVGMEPLPFRPLTLEEDAAIQQKIFESGAGLVFVSLGCPKQEYWIHQHKNKIRAVMVGLGGVFPVVAGIHKKAPLWMQNLGLEWFYRLIQEPTRLWKRYAATIPPFIYLALKQLLSAKFSS